VSDDRQSLSEKTFLVTGANTGIGCETARDLARRGAQVFVTGRSADKLSAAVSDIAASTGSTRVRTLALDLGDLDSVRACAEEFLETGEPLHGLINNAGLAGQRGLTASGFEIQFGTNHVGPFLLTALLLDRLRESAPARIVIVASEAHHRANGIDYDAVRRSTPSIAGFSEYGVSKLANVLHAQELGRRLEGTGVTTYALHPGVVASDVWRRVPGPLRWMMKRRMLSPTEGAQPSLRCATAPELAEESGLYYDRFEQRDPNPVTTAAAGAELWARSEEWVGTQVSQPAE
jgi:dehydrogenase/reductase SDR family protein 13